MNPDTIKNTIQAVIDGLTPLAQKLQVPLEGLWKWGLKHNYAVAIEELFAALLCTVGIYWSIKAIKKAIQVDLNNNYEDSTGYWVTGIMGVILCIVGFVILSIFSI